MPVSVHQHVQNFLLLETGQNPMCLAVTLLESSFYCSTILFSCNVSQLCFYIVLVNQLKRLCLSISLSICHFCPHV